MNPTEGGDGMPLCQFSGLDVVNNTFKCLVLSNQQFKKNKYFVNIHRKQ